MSTTTPCPSCNSTDGNARWGHEISEIYDGILFWSCAACGHAWSRDFGPRIGLQRKADDHVERLRASVRGEIGHG